MASNEPGKASETAARLVAPMSDAVVEFLKTVNSDIQTQVRAQLQEFEAKLEEVLYLFEELEKHQRIFEARVNDALSRHIPGGLNTQKTPDAVDLDAVFEAVRRRVDEYIAAKKYEFWLQKDVEINFTRDEVIGFLDEQQYRIFEFVSGQQTSIQRSVQEKLEIVVRDILNDWNRKRAAEYEERVQDVTTIIDFAVCEASEKISNTAKSAEEQLASSALLEQKLTEMKNEMHQTIREQSEKTASDLQQKSEEHLLKFRNEAEKCLDRFSEKLYGKVNRYHGPVAMMALLRMQLKAEVTEQVNAKTASVLRALLGERRTLQQLQDEQAQEEVQSHEQSAASIKRSSEDDKIQELHAPFPAASSRTTPSPQLYSGETGSATTKSRTSLSELRSAALAAAAGMTMQSIQKAAAMLEQNKRAVEAEAEQRRANDVSPCTERLARETMNEVLAVLENRNVSLAGGEFPGGNYL